MNGAWKSLAVVGAVFLGTYAYTAPLGKLESLISSPADNYYNLLVQGFRAGQLSLKKEIPPGLAHLADPYDPVANAPFRSLPYRLSDLSYYKGRFYLYFGVTPALLLYWPYAALTGHYLTDRQAVTIFCAIGILASLGLLRALWRRYFTDVSAGVVVACALGLALATGVPVLLPQSDVYEVAIIGGYMLTMLALAAIWRALHEPEHRRRWLATASLAYGLAVGARPSLLFGAVILLVPVIQAWREQRRIGTVLLAATGPILVIGLGLMYYNDCRFDNPFEFGVRYQLGGQRQVTWQFFSLRYLWFNFRVYFLEPVRWRTPFPFVHGIAVPPVPTSHNGVVEAFGILTNTPLTWLALAAPLAWRGRPEQTTSALHWFVIGVAVMVGTCALTLSLVCGANLRYEVDFLPSLLVLAVIGILGLDRALADQPVRRRAARWGWGLLLSFSVVFNLLMSLENRAYAGCAVAGVLAQEGRETEAIRIFEEALRIKPDYPEGQNNLAVALWQAGRSQEALEHWKQALRIKPDYAVAYNSLGVALAQQNGVSDAIRCFGEALRLKPDYAEAHYNLGKALRQVGRMPEAIGQFEESLRLAPYHAEVHTSLGKAFLQTGKTDAAIEQFREAVLTNPDDADAHDNLGVAFAQTGRLPEAIDHFKAAARLQPNDAPTHYNLGCALEQAGRTQDAIGCFQRALRLKPDFTPARTALARLQTHP